MPFDLFLLFTLIISILGYLSIVDGDSLLVKRGFEGESVDLESNVFDNQVLMPLIREVRAIYNDDGLSQDDRSLIMKRILKRGIIKRKMKKKMKNIRKKLKIG